MDLLINHITNLVTVRALGSRFKRGKEMTDIGLIRDGAVGIDNERIVFVGTSSDVDESRAKYVINGKGKTVTPGFVDSHTHLVFAGTREHEFSLRNAGASYAEIHRSGGGINNTVRATRSASKEELLRLSLHRLDTCLSFGTTTVEIKSGYGLTFEHEVKMLEVIQELRERHVLDVVSTCLGAHTIPFDYKDRRQDYIAMLLDQLIPYVAEHRLAEFVDVFCEEGAFSIDEGRSILQRAVDKGLGVKVHADQLTSLGGSRLAAEFGAVSADHLDHLSDEDIVAMKRSGTVAVVLPGVSLFLGLPMADARRLIEQGLPVAVATDANPGSCMSENIQLMMTVAGTMMHLTVEEIFTAVTLNAAAALRRSEILGSIEVGKQADLLIFDVPSYEMIPYHMGVNHLSCVIKRGRKVLDTMQEKFND
ncbi:MAG: imidazolonepropionase [Chlorobi bacterium]|nr:imidazolonepropionase [Chlorobiota bacterium]